MPFKGCLSDACVLMKIERFVLKPLRKIERFVLKQHTFRFADYKSQPWEWRVEKKKPGSNRKRTYHCYE